VRHRPGLSLGLFVGLTALVAAGGGWAAGRYIKSPQELAAETQAPPTTLITVPVESGHLVDSLSKTGVVRRAREQAIPAVAPLSGNKPIITSTPVAAGQVVRSGDVIAEIADRPVFILEGRIPLLRDLRPGDTGADVTRRRDALAGAGYESQDAPGVFGQSTTRAVETLYRDAGYQPPGTTAATGVVEAPSSLLVSSAEFAFVAELPATLTRTAGSIGTSAEDRPIAHFETSDAYVRIMVNTVEAQGLKTGTKVELSTGGYEGAGGSEGSGHVLRVGTAESSAEKGLEVPVDVTLGTLSGRARIGSEIRAIVRRPIAKGKGLLVPVSVINVDASGRTVVFKVENAQVQRVVVQVVGEADGTAMIRSDLLRLGDSLAVGRASHEN
jgi:peptidoglycan hydrolase-like protein with peptidoglycan-binding domain